MDMERVKNLFRESIKQFSEFDSNYSDPVSVLTRYQGPFEEILKAVKFNADNYFNEKKQEVLQDAETQAKKFIDREKEEFSRLIDEKIEKIEQTADRKMKEYEKRLDLMLEKEIKIKIKILVYTLLTILAAGLISLGYLWLRGMIM